MKKILMIICLFIIKSIKTIFIVLSSLLVLIFVSTSLLLLIINEPSSLDKMERDFMKNKGDIVAVADYMSKSKYANIVVLDTSKKGEWFAFNEDERIGKIGGDMPIGNADIEDKINKLLKRRGYQNIYKDGKTIVFQRWSNIGNNSGGVAFSIDGDVPKINYISQCVLLKEGNWYYYETDFEAFKKSTEKQTNTDEFPKF